MAFFKYGFIFLAGAGFGAAMAHRKQHNHGHHCCRRWSHRDGAEGRHELEPAPASYHDSRAHFGPRANKAKEGEYSLKESAATSV